MVEELSKLINNDVQAAAKLILDIMNKDADRAWKISEIQHYMEEWSAPIIHLALFDLRDRLRIRYCDDLRIRLAN